MCATYLHFPPIVRCPRFVYEAHPFMAIEFADSLCVPYKMGNQTRVIEQTQRPVPQRPIVDIITPFFVFIRDSDL